MHNLRRQHPSQTVGSRKASCTRAGVEDSRCVVQIGKIRDIREISKGGGPENAECTMAWYYRPEEAEGGRKVGPQNLPQIPPKASSRDRD